MSNKEDTAREKLTLLADRKLMEGIKEHRHRLEEQTGLRVSMTGAAAQLIRTGLVASQNSPSLPH